MKFTIKKSILQNATENCILEFSEKNKIERILNSAKNLDSIQVSILELPPIISSYLLQNSKGIPAKARAIISTHLFGSEFVETKELNFIWSSSIDSLVQICEVFSLMSIKTQNVEIYYSGRWYPIFLSPKYCKATRYDEEHVLLEAKLQIAEKIQKVEFRVYDSNLEDRFGKKHKKTLTEIMAIFGIRMPSIDPKNYSEKLYLTEELREKNGLQMYYQSILDKNIGINSINKVIVESAYELVDNSRERDFRRDEILLSKLPFIRVFSLLTKEYIHVDVEDLSEYIYQKDAIKHLFLPDKLLAILKKIFETPINMLIGDMISGKHGGMIIMACGEPGVGKTTSAEVYAETIEKPLYILDIAELGTNVKQVEENLTKVLGRAERWELVILLDEVDVFMSKRDDNLERSAIVGIFLRLLDYFKGVMFLTTNRADVLDQAIHSRVTLKINFPALDNNYRLKVWMDKLKNAQINVKDGFDKIAELNLNGREIRNMVRVAKILYPNEVTQNELIEMINFAYLDSK